MKLRPAFAIAASLSLAAAAGCSRSAIEAVNLANEGDQLRSSALDEAIAKYEQATLLDATNHRIFWKLAMAHRKKEDWAKVASTLARAAQIAPTFANYYYERGYAMEELAAKKQISWADAKEPLKKCSEVDPNYADCWHELGWVSLWSDDEQDALANYTKAIEHKADETRYYVRLGELYLTLGYLDQAQQVMKEGLGFVKEGDKFAYGLHVLLSQVLQQRGQLNDMVAELEAARKVAGDDHPEILYNLGSAYAVLEPPRKTEAIQMLKGFSTRACRGASGQAKYKAECETAQAQVARLGGSMQ